MELTGWIPKKTAAQKLACAQRQAAAAAAEAAEYTGDTLFLSQHKDDKVKVKIVKTAEEEKPRSTYTLKVFEEKDKVEIHSRSFDSGSSASWI